MKNMLFFYLADLASQGIKVNYGMNNSSPRKISNTYEIDV